MNCKRYKDQITGIVCHGCEFVSKLKPKGSQQNPGIFSHHEYYLNNLTIYYKAKEIHVHIFNNQYFFGMSIYQLSLHYYLVHVI